MYGTREITYHFNIHASKSTQNHVIGFSPTFTVLALSQQSPSGSGATLTMSICTLDYPITTCVKAFLTKSEMAMGGGCSYNI